MGTSLRPVAAAVALVVASLLLGACGGGDGERPSVDPTRTLSPTGDRPSPTRSPTRSSSPTESESAPEQSEPAESPQPSEPAESAEPSEPAESPEPSETAESPEPSETAESSEATTEPSPEAGDETDAETDGSDVPTALWWLLAALAIGLAVGIPLLLRSRRRRAWQSDLTLAVAEVSWLARELVPELSRMGSRAQAAGGWAVSAERAGVLEEKLTTLDVSAPDESGRARARTLHDAVHVARQRLGALDSGEPDDTLVPELRSVAADLESALRSVGAGPPAPGGTSLPQTW